MRPAQRIFAEDVLCLLLLSALAAAACFPVLLLGRAPVAGNSILFQPPWEEARPPHMSPDTDPAGERQVRQYYPWYVFIHDAAQYGDSILWNPFEGCGMPFLALWRSRCLSPFSLPFYVISTPLQALRISVLLKLIVAGVCGFLAARKLGFAAPLALFVGVTCEFSGPVFLRMGYPMSDVIPWLPMWIVYAERLILGQARYWAYGALFIALMALGGDPESLAAAIVFGTLFILVRMILQGKRPVALRASTLAFLASLVVGAALAAVQTLPYIEFVREAASTGRPESNTVLGWRDLAVIFLPHFFGRGHGLVQGRGMTADLGVVNLLHVGLVSVTLLPLWFSLRRFVLAFDRRRTESMVLVAVMMTSVSLVGHDRLSQVPLLKWFGPEHFLIGNALAFAFMAAAAAEEWVALNAEQCKRTILWLVFFMPLLAVAAFVTVWVDRDLSRPAAPPLVVQAAITCGFVLLLFALLTGTVFRPSVRLMGYGLSAVAFATLFTAFAPGIAQTDGTLVFPRTDFIQSLSEKRTRLCGSEALKRWPLQGNLVAQVNCPTGVELKRHAAFFDKARTSPLLFRRMGAPALLLTKEDVQGEFASIRSRLEIHRVFSSGAILFNDLGSKPRAWVAYQVQPVDKFHPEKLGVDQPPLVEGVAPALIAAPGPEARTSISDSERYDRVPVHIEETRPGVLILSDAWYPGWKATVDGAEALVFPVDGLFRGVQVGEGTHDVVFYFDSDSFKLGRLISIGGAIVTALGMAYTAIVRFRSHRHPF